MPFTPKDWKDYPDTTTPINAAALEDLETRLSNYTDAGGGGGGGLGPGSYKAGDLVFTPAPDATGAAKPAGQVFYIWVPLIENVTLDRIAVYVRTAAASSTVRLGIYADDGAGRPGSRTLDAGTVDTSTTGGKAITISQAVTTPGFWGAYLAAGGAPTTDALANGFTLGVSYGGNYNGAVGYTNAMEETGTVMPATAAPSGNEGLPPLIYGRIA